VAGWSVARVEVGGVRVTTGEPSALAVDWPPVAIKNNLLASFICQRINCRLQFPEVTTVGLIASAEQVNIYKAFHFIWGGGNHPATRYGF